MNKKILPLVLTVILLCGSKNAQAEKPFVLPKGAIPVVYRNNHIYIPAKINGNASGNFIFDTGANDLSFDSTFYADSPLQDFESVGGRVGGVGTGGIRTVPFIIDTVDFMFGTYIHKTTNIHVSDRKSGFGDFFDGVIGHEYFSKNNYLMEINYAHEYLILHNDKSTIDLSDYTEVHMEKREAGRSSRFYIPISIQVNDSLEFQEPFMLDVGSGGGLLIATPIAEKYNLPALNTEKVRAVANAAGSAGQSTSVYFRAKSIEIGNYKLDQVELRYSEDRSGSLAMGQRGGLLGNRVLDHFDMVIDFATPALYLKPNRNFNAPFEDISIHRGFGYADRSQTMNGWIVRGFFEGSAAEKSGMLSGDKIIFVNGVSILEIPHEKQRDFWKNLDKVELVVLRNNEEMKFKFEFDLN
jgi:hypothetical protein